MLQLNSQFIEKIRHKNQHNLHSNDQDYYQHAADNHNHYHNDSVLGCTSIAFSSFFFLYVIYLYTQSRYTLKFEYYAIIRDFLSFFTSYYELPPTCVGFAINNSTVLSRMRSSTTLQFMLRFALSVTSWIGRAK